MGLFRWVTRGLQVGDLSALRELSRGWHTFDQEQIERLVKRGFLRIAGNNRTRVTVLGRIALIIRRNSRG